MSRLTKHLLSFTTAASSRIFRFPPPLICSGGNPNVRYTSINPHFISVKKFSASASYFNQFRSFSGLRNEQLMTEEDRERWMTHIRENDVQARLVADLKSRRIRAIEDMVYEDAVKLKVKIAAATKDDIVGRIISDFNKATEEGRYEDAAFLRDNAGTGLVGWWVAVSEDGKDPYGQIIHISAEHGRYLARSYSPWQLATAKDGTPLFEIYVKICEKGEYKEQAFYLKQKAVPKDSQNDPFSSSESCKSFNLHRASHKFESFKQGNEDTEDGVDQDSEWPLKDSKLGIRIFKVNPEAGFDWVKKMAKLARKVNTLSKKNGDVENYSEDDGDEEAEVGMNSSSGVLCDSKKTVVFFEFAVGAFLKKDTGILRKELFREPAFLERKGSLSFSLTVEEDKDQQDSGDNILEGYRTIDHVNFEIAEFIGREIDIKMEDAGKFWPLVRSRAQNQNPLLSGLTTFSLIDVPTSSDPLNGLYIGSNGYLVTEVIQIKRIFGQWHKDISQIESYDYVEVVKLTGDPDVPAGQVAFRGKVGEKYKLPPKVILENKFGVVARYRGQGRMTGFQNATWVDTDLLILSGECLNDGFAIGFLYSAPEYYFLKLFKQLKLPNFQDLTDLDF